MIKTAFHLIYIQWRKFFVKGDYFSFFALLAGLFLSLYAIYQHYTDYYFLLFLFVASVFFQHFGRNDWSLLRGSKHFRAIILGEYVLSTLPALCLFVLKKDVLYAVGCLVFLTVLVFLPPKSLKIKYPFSLFDPFWHISFRRYKLLIWASSSFFFILIGKIYENANLSVFGVLLATLVVMIPYFEREFKIYIRISAYTPKQYLHKQLRTGYKNFSLVWAPVLIFFLISYGFAWGGWMLLCYLLPLLGVLSKYAYFNHTLSQTVICIFSVATLQYGLFIFVLPFLYYRALSQLNIEKTNATH